MARQSVNADDILASIGLGKWQIIGYAALVSFDFSWCQALFGIILLGFLPDFACLPPDTGHLTSDSPLNLSYGQSCLWHNASTNTSSTCSWGYVYAEPKEASIISEWDLVCGKAFLSEISQTVLNVGLIVGALIFTPIADKYGRRKVIISCHFAFLSASLLNCLAMNITAFIIARFFLGIFLAATAMVSWVVTLELFVPEQRTLAALISNVVWAVCACGLPALGYLMKGLSWRYLQLATSSWSIVIIIGQYFFVDEPIRWLMANGRHDEAVTVIQKAGRLNGANPENISSIISSYLSKDTKDSEQEACSRKGRDSIDKEKMDTDIEQTKVSALALIRNSTLRRITLVVLLAWFTNSLTYIGLFMLSSTMSGDRYLNLFLSAVAEIPAALLLFPVILKCGRRTVLILLYLLAGISLISAAAIHVTLGGYTGYVALTAVVMLGKFAISGTLKIIFMYTPELYPTNIRSLGVGAGSVASRLGGLLSPFAATVAREVPWIPAAVFGGFCLLVALTCPLLPETRGKGLPQTLEDLDKLFLPCNDKPKKDTALKDDVTKADEAERDVGDCN